MSEHEKAETDTIDDFDLDLELDMDAPLGAVFAAAMRPPATEDGAPVSVSDRQQGETQNRAGDWAGSDPWSSFANERRGDADVASRSAFVDRLLSVDEDEETEVVYQSDDATAAHVFHDEEADAYPGEFDDEVLHPDDAETFQEIAFEPPSAHVFEDAPPPPVDTYDVTSPPPVDDEPELEVSGATDPLGLDYGFSSGASGGDRMVPRITIHAFCTKTSVLGVMRQVTRDRRMKNVTMEVHEGGVKAAIHYYGSETTPNLLLLEGAGDPVRLLQELDALAEYCDENIRVIIIGETNDIRLYRELMRRGVSEYLVAPIDPVQLIRAISGLFTDPDAPFTGKTLAVTGVKGGVGASSIAHNLAWALSERIKVNATLVDLDLNFGTTGLDFNQDPTATIADALMSPERFDEAVMGRLITRATDRLSLFAAPATLDRTYDLDPDTYTHVLEMVRGSVPFVVLDMPHIWSDWFKHTIVGADEVVVVSGPDLASLRNGKNLIDFLRAARPHDAPPKLVLNMVGIPKRPEIPAKDFGQAIGLQPTLVLPFEPQVFGTAANNGQMIFDVAGESKCAQAIDQLAAMLTGKEVQAPKPSLLKKILLGK